MSILSTYWHILFRQSIWIPKPALTEHNLPDQTGKVFLVTGGNTGVGFELCKLLFGAHGTVYLTSRDAAKGASAIERIRAAHPTSHGRLELLRLDLADLRSIAPAAEEFRRREKRLHVLWNNAGVMVPPAGSTTAQGLDLQMGTNCVAPYLLTRLLLPTLRETAREAAEKGEPNGVRVAWAGSAVIDLQAKRGGVELNADGRPRVFEGMRGRSENYAQSKTGNLFLAHGFGKEVEGDGIISVCFNPGNLNSELSRYVPFPAFFKKFLLWKPIMGAYTELYCGLSPNVTTTDSGSYIAPWGVKSWNRKDIEAGVKDGTADKFVEFCFSEVKNFM